MKISYQKMFKLMHQKGIVIYDFRKEGFSPTVMYRLAHNQNANIATILRVCDYLDCQPGDIMECVEEQ